MWPSALTAPRSSCQVGQGCSQSPAPEALPLKSTPSRTAYHSCSMALAPFHLSPWRTRALAWCSHLPIPACSRSEEAELEQQEVQCSIQVLLSLPLAPSITHTPSDSPPLHNRVPHPASGRLGNLQLQFQQSLRPHKSSRV